MSAATCQCMAASDLGQEKECGLINLDWEFRADIEGMQAADKTTECGVGCHPGNVFQAQLLQIYQVCAANTAESCSQTCHVRHQQLGRQIKEGELHQCGSHNVVSCKPN